MPRMENFIIASLLLCIFSYTASEGIVDLTVHDDNPDTKLDSLQLIRKAGFSPESHVVVTDDGYLLAIHRVRGKPGAPSIFVQHGLFGSSADWLIRGESSLIYLLANNGYDVWLGNVRGNTYSRGHVSLSTDDPKYWEFSWNEIGTYDLPTMISYVTNFTGQPLKAYIGYSMGTTSFYVMCSERPEMQKLVQSMYSLAPIIFVKHIDGLLKYLAPFANDIDLVTNLLGIGEFLPQNFFVRFFSKYVCYLINLEEKLCANGFFTFTGFDNEQFNYTLMPILTTHIPAGASVNTLVHYSQEIVTGFFRKFDYGKVKNMLKYHSAEPPSYNISNITVPHTLFFAPNDWLSRSIDLDKFISKLSVKPNIYKVPFAKFNHIDYLFAKDALEIVYKPLLEKINSS